MPTRETRLASALIDAKHVREELGREIKQARVTAATSQREAGAAVGMSHSQFGRIERAELEEVTVAQLALACSAVGLRLVSRAVPGGDSVMDSGQLALLRRFRGLIPPTALFSTEVPFPGAGDRRAWDGLFRLEGVIVAVEAETRIRDVQALDRRCAVKLRDGLADVLILAVSDTAWNRQVLAAHREVLRPRFPLDGRQLLPALRAGHAPTANGIVVI